MRITLRALEESYVIQQLPTNMTRIELVIGIYMAKKIHGLL